MNDFRDYRRRNKYRLCLNDELHDQLSLAEPFEGARIRPARKRHLLKLLRYKRQAKGIGLSRS